MAYSDYELHIKSDWYVMYYPVLNVQGLLL